MNKSIIAAAVSIVLSQSTFAENTTIFLDSFDPQKPGWSYQSPTPGIMGKLNNNVNVGSVSVDFDAPYATDGDLQFDLLAFDSLDDFYCCTDTLSVYLNGNLLFSGTYASYTDGRSKTRFIENPAGASFTRISMSSFSKAVYRMYVPLIHLNSGKNTITWSYSPLQEMRDESWGLDNVIVKKMPTPVITSVSPQFSFIGKPTIFEVQGSNLRPNMGFTVGDCAYSNTPLSGGTPEKQQFICTQFGQPGTKAGIIKTAPGGKSLFRFTVSANKVIPEQTVEITGAIKTAGLPAKKVLLQSSDNSVDSCQTDDTGNFKCLVPIGWNGTLTPISKDTTFLPARISIANAATNQVTPTIIGTVNDTFPLGSKIPSDWSVGTTDSNGWKLALSTGDITDTTASEGRLSLRSGSVGFNQKSGIQTSVNATESSFISFTRKVSSNPSHGKLNFYIDGDLVASWSGVLPWEKFKFPLSPGAHVIRWEYAKDSMPPQGLDSAWIDEVSYSSSESLGVTTCAGITVGALKLMRIKNPTCDQVSAFVGWLKFTRPYLSDHGADLFDKANSIDQKNQRVQKVIEWGLRIAGYLEPSIVTKKILGPEVALGVISQLKSDGFGIACKGFSSETEQNICDTGKSAALAAVDYGFKYGMEAIIGKVSGQPPYLYAIEKSIATYFNLMYAYQISDINRKINSNIIAISILDNYFKLGKRMDKLCSSYGTSCSSGITYLPLNVIEDMAGTYGYYSPFNIDLLDLLNSFEPGEVQTQVAHAIKITEALRVLKK